MFMWHGWECTYRSVLMTLVMCEDDTGKCMNSWCVSSCALRTFGVTEQLLISKDPKIQRIQDLKIAWESCAGMHRLHMHFLRGCILVHQLASRHGESVWVARVVPLGFAKPAICIVGERATYDQKDPCKTLSLKIREGGHEWPLVV